MRKFSVLRDIHTPTPSAMPPFRTVPVNAIDPCGGESRHSQPRIGPPFMWGNVGYLVGTCEPAHGEKPRKSGVFLAFMGIVWKLEW